MAAVVSGRPHRASGELALHVLEVMETIHCERPAPFPPDLADGDVSA